MLINEWQLGNELNQALQHQHRADFQLWLSFLSVATEEQASFCLADTAATAKPVNLRQQLQLADNRDPALQPTDIGLMYHQGQTFIHGGFAALRLSMLLQPQPQVVQHDAKKLNADLLDNLSLHCQRHLRQQTAPQQTTDATLLYDVLEQLQPDPLAA